MLPFSFSTDRPSRWVFISVLLFFGCAGGPDTSTRDPVPAQNHLSLLLENEPMATSSELRFAIAGDIMVHGRQLNSAYDKKCDCYDFHPMFSAAPPLFKGADVAIANLETTLPGKNYSGYPAFGAPDTLVDAIKSTGINLLLTANNHVIDKGKTGLQRTLQVLNEKGMRHIGVYASQEDYDQRRIFVLEQKGMRIAMLNYTYGTNEIPTPAGTVVNRIEKSRVTEDLALARAKGVDMVMVFYHFGAEYLNQPDKFQLDMVKHALAGGADIVIGGHPHHVQPYQLFTQPGGGGRETPRLVAYSLGNFISGQRRRYTDGGMVFYFTLRKHNETDGSSYVEIADVHHKLVWVYMKPADSRFDFRLLPIERTLAGEATDLELSDHAVQQMKRFRTDADTVLGRKEDQLLNFDPTQLAARRAPEREIVTE